MAYVADKAWDEETAQTKGPLSATSAQVNPSVQAQSIGQGQAPMPNPPAKGGSSTQDASKYFAANQDQAKRLGAKVAQGLNAQNVAAGNSLRQAQGEFSQAQAPYQGGLNYDLINPVLNTIGGQKPLPQGPMPAQQVRPHGHNWQNMNQQPGPQQQAPGQHHGRQNTQPVPAQQAPQYSFDPAALNYITSLRNQNYQGPTSLAANANYQNALTQANQAAQTGANMQTDAGRMEALKKLSGGGFGFDNALLQTQAAQAPLQTAYAQNQAIQNQIAAANPAAQAQSQAAQANYGANWQALQGLLNAPYQNIQQDVAARAAQGNQQLHGKARHNPPAASSYETPEQQAQLGALRQLSGLPYVI